MVSVFANGSPLYLPNLDVSRSNWLYLLLQYATRANSEESSEQQLSEDGMFYCSLCEVEVYKFSKHSRWLNNCIGKRNYRKFFTLMVSSILLGHLVDGGDYIRKEQAIVADASSALTRPTTNAIEISNVVSATTESVGDLKTSPLKRKRESVDIKTGSPIKEALFQSIVECTSVDPSSVPACEEAAEQSCPPL